MKRFRIYRNLHRNNFSIQSYLQERKGYRVTDRVSSAILNNCKFRIYESGRQKVINERRKNVHAYIEPESYKAINEEVDVSNFREIYYNPYKFDSFVYKDNLLKVDSVETILAYNNRLYDVSNGLV